MIAAILLTTGVTVSLPTTVEVKGTELTVGAIAQVSGEDAALVARVEATSLGYSPAPGFSRLLDQRRVAADLRRLMPSVEFHVAGALRCRVTPAVVTVTAARLLDEAGTTMRDAFAGVDTRITARGLLGDLIVPAARENLELRADLREREPRAGAWSVPVQVLVDGAVYRTIYTQWNVEVWAHRHVLRRDVRVGEALSLADFELARVQIGSGPASRAIQPATFGGGTAVRALAKGHVVTERDIRRAVVIQRGDTIALEVRRGNVTVRTLAVALRDAHVGDRLPVRVVTSGREFVAVVTSTEAVELHLK
jgi:flagella basal body P-ring formation protein FlgA